MWVAALLFMVVACAACSPHGAGRDAGAGSDNVPLLGMGTKPQTKQVSHLSVARPVTVDVPLSIVVSYPGEPEDWSIDDIRRTYDTVRKMGVTISHIYYAWGEIEKKEGKHHWNDIDFAVHVIKEQNLKVSFAVKIVDSSKVGELPKDVKFRTFTDPALRKRFKEFLLAVLARHKGKIDYLWIGNEIDSYFHNRRDEFDGYVSFYREAYDAVKTKYPSVRIGTISTYHDAKNNNALDLIEKIGKYGDLIGFSLYPQMITKSSRQPDGILTDMGNIAAKVRKRYAITETAWSTQGFGGSESAQSQYLRDLFKSYKSRREQVEFLGFFTLYDFPESVNRSLAEHYGIAGHKEFVQFQGSLGLARSSGQSKEGWATMLDELGKFQKTK